MARYGGARTVSFDRFDGHLSSSKKSGHVHALTLSLGQLVLQVYSLLIERPEEVAGEKESLLIGQADARRRHRHRRDVELASFAVNDEPRMDAEMAERVVEQAYEFWIGPEIQRRREAGELRDDFALQGAQVIFGMDEGSPEVRLNEEVKAVAIVTAARAVDKGQDVTEEDVAGYKEILLTEEDPDAGHITIVAHLAGWALAFDFRRNASRIAEHSEVARQFLEAAEWAREQGYESVFVDVLFSATELMAKGMLIWQPDRSLLDSKTHRYLRVRFNQERKMNNVDSRFAALLNRLWQLREPARYLARDFELAVSEMDEMLAVAREMHGVLVAMSPRRASFAE